MGDREASVFFGAPVEYTEEVVSIELVDQRGVGREHEQLGSRVCGIAPHSRCKP